jgi:polyketide biosynthesis enoyl-CoA hydratase PksI
MTAWESRSAPELVRYRPAEDGIGWIEMIDDAGRNAFSDPFVGALLSALDAASADSGLSVLVLAGLPDMFCSGATAEVLTALAEGRIRPTELGLGERLLAAEVPVIVAAEGHAIGGGFALLAAADLAVIAAESRYGANFMALGITPGMGATRLLDHFLPPATAAELLYGGDLVRGSALAGRSHFNAIVARTEVRHRATLLARNLAEKPRNALRLLKRTMALPRRRAFQDAVTLESLMHEQTLANLTRDEWRPA